MAKKIGEPMDVLSDIQQPMSEQERLQRCNVELAQILEKYGCVLEAVPQSRAEGSILLIMAAPRLALKPN